MSDIPLTDPHPFTRPSNWFDRIRKLAIARLAQRERARRELARTNFLEYVRVMFPTYDAGWVHVEICAALDAFLQAVVEKRRPRLIINLPPRHGKSELVSRLFPTYILGRFPNFEVVLATGTGDFASKLGRAVRTNFKNQLFTELFPDTQLEGAIQAADNIETTAAGSFFTVGVGGQLTGRGAHILIGDDLVVDQEQADSDGQLDAIWDWYQAVARTRVAAGGGIIIMHTRWSELDPCGRLFELELEDPKADRWQKLIYPAIATADEPHRKKGEALHPSRWPLDELESLKRDMSPRMWSALYQQNPVPLEGVLFKKEWIERTVARDTVPTNCYHYTLTDLAISEEDHAAYSVIRDMLVDAENNIYYGDIVRRKMGPKDLVEAIIDTALSTNAQYIQLERTQTTMALWPYLLKRMEERGCDVPIWEGTPTKDKVARTTSLRGRMEQGRIFYIDTDDHHAHVVPEYLAFPAGKYKDIVDCFPAGTPVLTDRGERAIETLRVGDLVWTRYGWKPISAISPPKRAVLITKFGITATANHPIYTANRGFIPLDSLTWGDTLLECQLTSDDSAASPTDAIPTRSDANISVISSTAPDNRCIARSGRTTAATYQRDITSTTATKIHSTIQSAISSAVRRASTYISTASQSVARLLRTWLISRVSDRSRKRGTAAPLDKRSTEPMENGCGKSGNGSNSSASSAAVRMQRISAGEYERKTSIARSSARAEQLNDAVRSGIAQDVFNIKVAECPEYIAGGVLVHNCDAWGVLMLNELELPPPPDVEPEDAPHPDSYEGMMKRVASRPRDNHHVPAYVTGEPRRKRRASY